VRCPDEYSAKKECYFMNKMNKKLLALLLSGVMTLSMAACSSVSRVSQSTSDGSVSDATFASLQSQYAALTAAYDQISGDSTTAADPDVEAVLEEAKTLMDEAKDELQKKSELTEEDAEALLSSMTLSADKLMAALDSVQVLESE
jgi:type II secretory pathway predicted ATPase ExeA